MSYLITCCAWCSPKRYNYIIVRKELIPLFINISSSLRISSTNSRGRPQNFIKAWIQIIWDLTISIALHSIQRIFTIWKDLFNSNIMEIWKEWAGFDMHVRMCTFMFPLSACDITHALPWLKRWKYCDWNYFLTSHYTPALESQNDCDGSYSGQTILHVVDNERHLLTVWALRLRSR